MRRSPLSFGSVLVLVRLKDTAVVNPCREVQVCIL